MVWQISFKRIMADLNVSSFEFVGWLIRAKRPSETVFQSISGRLPERREKKCPNNPVVGWCDGAG